VIAGAIHSSIQADLLGTLKKPPAGIEVRITECWPMYTAIWCSSNCR
jgi:hypothetical protein